MGRLLPSVVGGYGLAVWSFVAALVLVVPGGGQAAGSAATVVVSAPARVALGEPINLRLSVVGSPGVAGYETQLLFDAKAAHLLGVDHRGAGVAALGWDVRDLGPIELTDGVAFGSYACRSSDCVGRALSQPAGARGDVSLGTVVLRADRPGLLRLRLTATRLVDAAGSSVQADRGEQVVTVQVGGRGGQTHAAPPARPARPEQGGRRSIRDATGDGRVDEADVTQAALRWVMAHADDGGCRTAPGSAVDVTQDGCIDVADVQSLAAGTRVAAPVAAGAAAANPPFAVNSTGDSADAAPGDGVCSTGSGTCTLRAAMQEANAQAGSNEIDFAIPGSGVQTIQLASHLPTMSDTTGGTLIDGYTQSGAVPNTDPFADNAQLKIQVRGTGQSGVDGPTVTSAGNTLRGISFFNLRRPLFLYGHEADGNRIVGCFVGTDATGTFGHTVTDFYASGIAIEAGAGSNQVGDTALADRNVISGNARHGIVTYNEGSDHNTIYNNIIGLSPSGLARLPNIKIGLDINAGSSFNVVGGTGPGMRNVFSGTGIIGSSDSAGGAGVEMSHAATTTGNRVVGNYFGTDVTGTTAPSYARNAFWGIHVEDHVNNSVISDNVIVNSLNGALRIQDAGTMQNLVTNNRIGVTTTGQPSRNEVYNVYLSQGATANRISGNIIANSPVGVRVSDTGTDGNTITQNSIFGNDGLGIDLDPYFQVNPNDPGDVDTGSNEQLNFPVIGQATPTAVSGTACGGCVVEVFLADSNGPGTAGGPGAGSNGEGRTYLASATADGAGQFTAPISGVNGGQWVTATATDGSGNTSEFSDNVQVRTTSANPPGTPSLTAAGASGATVSLQWNPPASNGGSAITKYNIYRGTASGGESFLVQVGNVSNYIDLNVDVGTTYWYEVSALNAVGEGPLSNERSATPGGNIIVSDRFERSVASGLGTADIGGSWSVSSTTRTKVQNGEAVIYGWSGGSQDVRAWTEDVRQDMELLGLVRLNATNPVGASYKPRLMARAQADSRNGYSASITHTNTGALNWQLSRLDNAGGTGSLSLANGTLVASGADGTRWWIRLRVQGTSIKVRYWLDGTNEPSAWTASVTDTYWASGRASFGVSTTSGLTSPFPDTGFANFDALDLNTGNTAPSAPSLSAASAGIGSVALQWSAPASNGGSAIINYNIYRGTASGGETLLTQVGNVTTYTDGAVTNGTTYWYKVSAVNVVGEGPLSNELSATPQAPAAVPGAPSLTSASPGNGSVALQWSAPASNGGSAITNYNIYRGTASGGETLLTQVGNVTTYTDGAVTNGTTYWYKVSAVNAVGEGPLSNELSATPSATAVFLSDQFERTVAAGLGTADIGGTWSVSSTAKTKVDTGEASIYGWTGGGQDVQAWTSTVKQDMELLALVHLNATNPVGANYSARVMARAQSDARNGYSARISHTTAGAVTWALSRIDNAGGTGSLVIGSGSLLSSGAPGTRWWIRLRVQGTSIKARFWRDGTSEPSNWTVQATDSYWTSGQASLGALVNAGITSPFPQMRFDSFEAVDLG